MANEFTNNENRARLKDSINRPTDRSASGPPIGANSPNPMPPGILGPAGMMRDPHAGGRNSALQNLSVRPAEKLRAAETAEIQRRLRPGSGDTYK
jgi:hypothetical protein